MSSCRISRPCDECPWRRDSVPFDSFAETAAHDLAGRS